MSLNKSNIKKVEDTTPIVNFNKYLTSKYKSDDDLWNSGLEELLSHNYFVPVSKVYYNARNLSEKDITEQYWNTILTLTLAGRDKKGFIEISLFDEVEDLLPDNLFYNNKESKKIMALYIIRTMMLEDRLMMPLADFIQNLDEEQKKSNVFKHLRHYFKKVLLDNNFFDILDEILNEMTEMKVYSKREDSTNDKLDNFDKYVIKKFKHDPELWNSGFHQIVEKNRTIFTVEAYYHAKLKHNDLLTESNLSNAMRLAFDYKNEIEESITKQSLRKIPHSLLKENSHGDQTLNRYIIRFAMIDQRILTPFIKWVENKSSENIHESDYEKYGKELKELLINNNVFDIINELIKEFEEHKIKM